METNSKVFAIVMVFVLGMATMASASDAAKQMDLAGEDAGSGNTNESNRRFISPSTISPPIGNHAINQGHASPPKQSLPKSYNYVSAIPTNPPSAGIPRPEPVDLNPNSTKRVTDNTSQNPTNKEVTKSSEVPTEEDNKPMQSLEKGDQQAPVLVNKPPEALKADNEGTSKSGSPDKNNSKSESCETANASNLTCRTRVLVACLLQSETESKELFLIIQNTGEVDLNVNITSPGKIKIDSNPLKLPKQSYKKVNLMIDSPMDLNITLNAGKDDCLLQNKTPTSDWLYLPQFPAYAAQVRPMHGAFFLFAAVIVAAGTWTFCKFRKKDKRVDAGIPYQQLEMSTHTQSASAHVFAADTWDQSWDDDWDEEEAVVKDSAKHPAENVSSNGLSSKPVNSNQNGWEIDWDD